MADSCNITTSRNYTTNGDVFFWGMRVEGRGVEFAWMDIWDLNQMWLYSGFKTQTFIQPKVCHPLHWTILSFVA
jgi:hypothetical protein